MREPRVCLQDQSCFLASRWGKGFKSSGTRIRRPRDERHGRDAVDWCGHLCAQTKALELTRAFGARDSLIVCRPPLRDPRPWHTTRDGITGVAS
jgi:hypothetical protein